jgi:hypothetical protein
MSSLPDLKTLERLVDALESEDAFARREAIDELILLTQRQFGYRWRDPENDRGAAVKRWRRWLERETKQRQSRQMHATVQILAEGSGKLIDGEALQKLLKALPVDQAQQLMASVLAKMGAAATTQAHPVCEACGLRPATVSVTTLEDQGYRHERMCEVCAVPRSDA